MGLSIVKLYGQSPFSELAHCNRCIGVLLEESYFPCRLFKNGYNARVEHVRDAREKVVL
jgi:hypothetical protein